MYTTDIGKELKGMIKKDVFLDIHPKSFKFKDNISVIQFRNVLHYKNIALKLKSASIGSSAKHNLIGALENLRNNKSTYNESNFQEIKNNVKNVLQKRGLISSEDIYESYKYDVEGDIVDVAKVIDGDPNCMLRPAKAYTNYFYELYISLSIPYRISDEEIEKAIYTILATVQLLEKEHIYIKVNMIIPASEVSNDDDNIFIIVPLFSYKDVKDVKMMSVYLNRDALRCIYFAMIENIYGDRLNAGYGGIEKINEAIVAYDIIPEELASNIINKVIVEGER